MRAQGLVDVMHGGDIDRLVERTFGQDPDFSKQLLHMFIAGLGKIGRALFFVDSKSSAVRRGITLSIAI